MRGKAVAVWLWDILYPLLFYYAVMLIVMTLARQVFGTDDAHYVLCQLISSLATIPCMMPFYRQDQALRGIPKGSGLTDKKKIGTALWVVAVAGLISVSLNNIILMTPLAELSEGYREASAGFYGSTLALELVSSAIATPILEELVFRGILFARLRDRFSRSAAVLLSSFLFAVMHFNIVQFIYALLIGALLALLMEQAGHVYGAIAGHITANAIAVIRTECGVLAWSADKSVLAWVFSVILLIAGLAIWIKRSYFSHFLKRNCVNKE